METPPLVVRKTLVKSVMKSSLTPCRRLGLSHPSSGSIKRSLLVKTMNTPTQDESLITNKHCAMSNEQLLPLESKESMNVPGISNNVLLNKNTAPKARRCLSQKSPILQSRENLSSLGCSYETEKSNPLENSNSKLSSEYMSENNLIKKKRLDSEFQREKETLEPKQICFDQDDCAASKGDNKIGATTQKVTSEIIQQLTLSIKEKKKKLEQLKIQETYAKKHNLTELRSQTAKWKTAGQEALRYSVNLARQAGYSVTIKELVSQHGFPPHLIGYNADDDEFI